MQREQRRSPGVPTSEFVRLCRTVELLIEHGVPEAVIDDMLREKILGDIALEKAKRLQPSLN